LGFVRSQFPAHAGVGGLPAWVVKYGALLLVSGFTALLALAIYRSQHPHDIIEWYTGLLLGYGWESTIEATFYKITGKYANNPDYNQPPPLNLPNPPNPANNLGNN
jgi:hypothetical protein